MNTIMSSDKSDNNNQISNRMHGFMENASTTISSPAISPYQRAIHSQTPSSNNNGIEQMMFSNQFTTNITMQRQETNQSNSESQTKPMTKAELRKSNKPIMEKKRRARINHCLNELKTLILEAMKKDPARHTKLEKADILEMTVKYLQNLHRNPTMNINIPNDPVTVHRFRDGFSDCTNEVNRYINDMDGIDVNVKRRLMGHLSNCVSHMPHSNPVNRFASTEDTTRSLFSPTITANNNNNNNNNNSNPFWSAMPHQMSSASSLPEKNDVQFIPSRLSSGELALIIPNSVNMNYFSATGSFSLNQLSKSMEQSTSFGGSQPIKSKPMDTSPPLSPTSSISSNDSGLKRTSDYSSLENSFQTPQKPVPLFATSSSCNSSFEHSSFNSSDSSIIVPMALPPTQSSITAPPTTTSLQQQHVTSTTEPVGKFETDPANNGNNSMWRPW